MDFQQQAFEKAIDANPLESTNHHAYADWLEENGQHDEAAFRRSMGNWLQTNPPIGSYFKDTGPPEEPDNPQTWQWHLESNGWPGLDKPQGVSRFPFTHEAEYDDESPPYRRSTDPEQRYGHWAVDREPHHPVWVPYVDGGWSSPAYGMTGRFAWPNYRAMEQSFRESFMRNRANRMKRRVVAYKKFRRGA